MACELRILASVSDLQQCQKYLFLDATDDTNWLHKCTVAVSPVGDRAIVARGSALVILTAQWGKSSDEKAAPQLMVTKQWDAFENFSRRDEITCATLLPIAENRHHSSSGPDWTCIALGFSSGSIAFFTENMDLLIEHSLHREPMQRIRATSFKKRQSDGTESPEAIYAVFPSAICSFSAFSLFQTIRTCRSKVALRLAKAQGSTSDTTLGYKKYSFTKNTVRDATFIGCAVMNNFDHLLNCSLRGVYQPSPPQHSTVVCTGDNIYLQFLTTMEGVNAPINVADVAVSMLGNIVRNSWMGLMRGDNKETPEKHAEKLCEQFSVVDRERDGRAIAVSPDASLLAVTDSLGRVTLVDARTGVSLRLWKGYRDAECGFLEVEEDVSKRRRKRGTPHTSSKEVPRRVLVIIIYAPKKGLIEIFPIRHGPRIAAIRVSKNGRLIYTPHQLLGLDYVPRKSHGFTSSPVTFLCDEGFMDVSIPFHCAAMDAGSSAKDLYNLKQLKLWLKDGDHDEEEIYQRITEASKQLETNEVRFQAIDLIMSVKKISSSVLCSALDVFLQFATDEDVSTSSGNQRDLISYCKQVRKIVKFYEFLQQIEASGAESKAAAVELIEMTELLILSESEIKTLFDLLVVVQVVSGSKKENKVTFRESDNCDLSNLLKCLDVSDTYAIMAKSDLSEEEFCTLGDFFYRNVLDNMSYLETWTGEARSSNISATVLSRSFLIYWLNRPLDEREIRNFIPLFKAITSLSDETIVATDYNLESSWWTEIRNLIGSSSKPLAALTTAVCCRAVTIMCEQEAEIGKSSKLDRSAELQQGWENVSADTWQWDLLISHLEDIAILNAVLSVKSPKSKNGNTESPEVSLKSIVSSGESAVSELTAKWLFNFSLAPNLLINKSDVEFQVTLESPENLDKKNRKLLKCHEELTFPLIEIAEEVQPGSESEQIILGHVAVLKKRFPYSLTSSVILSHIFWEHLNKWQWNLANIDLLQTAVMHLETIPSTHLQIGMGCLAWSTFLKMHVEAIMRVVAKLGKLPTDTLCTKELGIPRHQILPLLRCSSQLLEVVLDACAQRPINTFIFRHESMWRESKPGLVRVATSRALPSKQLIHLHCMVIHIFELVANFDLKNRTLLPALFDTLKSQLFGELTQQKDINVNTLGLNDSIVQFLCSAISSAVQSESDGVRSDHGSNVSLKGFQFCLQQAMDWNVLLDPLRRHYVCELYSSGFDGLAEMVVDEVEDTHTLASQLLVIVGHRINAILASSASPHEVLACLSPSLTSWLNSLNKESCGHVSTEEKIEILLHRIMRWLAESDAESKLAGLLAESVPGILSMSKS